MSYPLAKRLATDAAANDHVLSQDSGIGRSPDGHRVGCDPEFDTSIEALDDYFLMNLFSYLNVREKLAIECVCKRWQTIVIQQLDKQMGLGTTWADDEDRLCLDSEGLHCVTGGDIRAAVVQTDGWFYDMTDSKTIDNLGYIARKCPNVRCIHISHALIDVQCFEVLVDLFPDLECLHLRNNILKDPSNGIKLEELWQSIGELLSRVILHLSLDPHYEYRMKECHLKALLQPMILLEEFRVGSNFDREVVGKFVQFLPKRCKLFYSIGRELCAEALNQLARNQSQCLTHLSFVANSLRTTDALVKVGENFKNLVKLKINLSFNETILTTSSPISGLTQLREFAVDLNTFSDAHVDDGLIWCIKDGLQNLQALEVSRACLSTRAFNAITYCLPQLNKLLLKTIEIQCVCENSDRKDRTERYTCKVCKERCWQSLANSNRLQEIQFVSYYYRNERPKPFHTEFCDLLSQFRHLRRLSIVFYDTLGLKLLEALNKLMKDTKSDDMFVLTVKTSQKNAIQEAKAPKVRLIKQLFML